MWPGGQPPLSMVAQGSHAISFLPVLSAGVLNFLFFGWRPHKEDEWSEALPGGEMLTSPNPEN